MKVRPAIFLLAVLALTGSLFAGVIKDSPRAHSIGDGNVEVTWASENEVGVLRYEVLRAQLVSGQLGDFARVGSIDQLKGNNSSYQFIDRGIFKTTDNIFAYKVRVVFTNQTYEETQSVITAVLSSAAKRTWGSIKAMFR